ncbi:merozoite surface protein 3 [Plasmodium malariae]|uniref:Merozoite surface protein 3 n=1 Tax=Plasmodium malariae TaxID=5858 RepID=A0A1A8X0C6_PLAMA|nr:merozoite surface protein 3 [Plasmodium malariae]
MSKIFRITFFLFFINLCIYESNGKIPREVDNTKNIGNMKRSLPHNFYVKNISLQDEEEKRTLQVDPPSQEEARSVQTPQSELNPDQKEARTENGQAGLEALPSEGQNLQGRTLSTNAAVNGIINEPNVDTQEEHHGSTQNLKDKEQQPDAENSRSIGNIVGAQDTQELSQEKESNTTISRGEHSEKEITKETATGKTSNGHTETAEISAGKALKPSVQPNALPADKAERSLETATGLNKDQPASPSGEEPLIKPEVGTTLNSKSPEEDRGEKEKGPEPHRASESEQLPAEKSTDQKLSVSEGDLPSTLDVKAPSGPQNEDLSTQEPQSADNEQGKEEDEEERKGVEEHQEESPSSLSEKVDNQNILEPVNLPQGKTHNTVDEDEKVIEENEEKQKEEDEEDIIKAEEVQNIVKEILQEGEEEGKEEGEEEEEDEEQAGEYNSHGKQDKTEGVNNELLKEKEESTPPPNDTTLYKYFSMEYEDDNESKKFADELINTLVTSVGGDTSTVNTLKDLEKDMRQFFLNI